MELLFVAAIFSFIIGMLLYAMSAGRFTDTLSSARADLQAEVRYVMGWIVKDVRQGVSWDIADTGNNPSPDHVKFRQVTGWDNVNNTFLLSSTYIEYSYDAVSKTITRSTSDGRVWPAFNYVEASPFFTIDSSGAVVPLNKNDLLTSKQLIIYIYGQKQAIGAQNTTYSLTEEVEIRNG